MNKEDYNVCVDVMLEMLLEDIKSIQNILFYFKKNIYALEKEIKNCVLQKMKIKIEICEDTRIRIVNYINSKEEFKKESIYLIFLNRVEKDIAEFRAEYTKLS